MSRFNIIKKYENIQYIETCPIIIIKAAITKDDIKEQVLSQIKFKNISTKSIKAVYIGIQCFGIDSTCLETLEEYIYLDLDVKSNQIFGEQTPIYLPNNKTREIKICCKKVVYLDGTIWENKLEEVFNNKEINTKFLQNIMEYNLFTELKIELEEDRLYFNELFELHEEKNIWKCVCGCLNLEKKEECIECGKTLEWWKNKLNEEILEKNFVQRKKEKEEQEELLRIQKEERQRKKRELLEHIKKKIGILKKIAIVAISVFVLIIIISQIIYLCANNNCKKEKYVKAEKQYNLISYYKDAKKMSRTMRDIVNYDKYYKKALTSYEKDNYEKCIEQCCLVYYECEETKEAKMLTNKFKSLLYKSAKGCYEKKNYNDAVYVYKLIGNYKDAEKKCILADDKNKFQLAKDAERRHRYAKALEYIDKIDEQTNEVRVLEDQINNKYAEDLLIKGESLDKIEEIIDNINTKSDYIKSIQKSISKFKEKNKKWIGLWGDCKILYDEDEYDIEYGMAIYVGNDNGVLVLNICNNIYDEIWRVVKTGKNKLICVDIDDVENYKNGEHFKEYHIKYEKKDEITVKDYYTNDGDNGTIDEVYKKYKSETKGESSYIRE